MKPTSKSESRFKWHRDECRYIVNNPKMGLSRWAKRGMSRARRREAIRIIEEQLNV